MKTVRIRYGRLRSLEGFNNVRLEKEVELELGDDPDTALHALRQDVDGSLGLMAQAESLQARYDRLSVAVPDLEARRDEANAEWQAMRTALIQAENFVVRAEAADVTVPDALRDLVADQIPF